MLIDDLDADRLTESLDEMLPDEQETIAEINRILTFMEHQEQKRTLDLLTEASKDRRTAVLERLRKNHYHLWKVLVEVCEHPERLRQWREAQKPTQEWRKSVQFDEAMKVLSFALDD